MINPHFRYFGIKAPPVVKFSPLIEYYSGSWEERSFYVDKRKPDFYTNHEGYKCKRKREECHDGKYRNGT